MKKKLTTLLFAVFVSMAAFAQNDAINSFFKQYESNEKFTLVSISPKMFKMMGKVKWDDMDPKVKNVISNLSSFRMITSEENGNLYYNEATKKLNLSTYEEIMTVRDNGENIRFFIKESNNIVNELVMLMGSKTDFMLMCLTGNIDLENINKLGSAINVKGMESLKNVKPKN